MSESLSLDNIPWMNVPWMNVSYGVGGVAYQDVGTDTTTVKIPSQCWTAKRTILKQKTYILESQADVIVLAKKRELFNIALMHGYDVLYVEYPDRSVELIGVNNVIQKMLLWLDSNNQLRL